MLGNLLGNSLCAVIEFAEAILIGKSGIANPFRQMFAKRFYNREDDATLADGIALNKVELSIGMRIVLCVQAIEVECPQEDSTLEPLFWQVTEINACRVALVLDVEAELVAYYLLCSKVIDILHHQAPSRQVGTSRSAFQQFYEECLRVVRKVACKLTHLIGCAHIGVFVGNGENVVHLQSA